MFRGGKGFQHSSTALLYRGLIAEQIRFFRVDPFPKGLDVQDIIQEIIKITIIINLSCRNDVKATNCIQNT